MTDRPQKITFAEMRDMGVRGVLVYCADYHCSHSLALNADRWPDELRLSDIGPRFVCRGCGRRGADVRPDFNWKRSAVPASSAGRSSQKIGRTLARDRPSSVLTEPHPRHGAFPTSPACPSLIAEGMGVFTGIDGMSAKASAEQPSTPWPFYAVHMRRLPSDLDRQACKHAHSAAMCISCAGLVVSGRLF